jgi:AGZA family xanthine/uracil permease-like MFS transporter
MTTPDRFRWWRPGDLDGFFGLFVDSLIQLLLIVTLCGQVLGMGTELLYGRILPGVAVSLLAGNLFYAFQARALARRTAQAQVTALPYGVNTVSLFAYILFVMLPVVKESGDPVLAWRVGLVACLGSGVIELGGAFVAGWVKEVTPRAALLATLAGIALTFISMDFCFRIFADPLVGLAPLALILLQYVGRQRLPAGLPAGLLAVVVGTTLAWGLGRMDGAAVVAAAQVDLRPPHPFLADLGTTLLSPYLFAFLPVIVPMGLFNLIGSLQNLESAEAAGDAYPVRSSLAANGIGTIIAACCGSCFPTTIYIGHPGWKGMGAGAGYSVANGVVITLLCCLGLVAMVTALIPIEAGAAILLWIGITIGAQAFQATPRTHAPAVVVGFFPALAAWGLLMLESGLRGAGQTVGSVGIVALAAQLPIAGMIALERGFIFTSMILAALTVALVEGRYRAAAAWAAVAATVSATGLMHGYRVTDAAIVNAYGPATTWPFVAGYLAAALLFLVLRSRRGDETRPSPPRR